MEEYGQELLTGESDIIEGEVVDDEETDEIEFDSEDAGLDASEEE